MPCGNYYERGTNDILYSPERVRETLSGHTLKGFLLPLQGFVNETTPGFTFNDL